jgi:hypothetical protein
MRLDPLGVSVLFGLSGAGKTAILREHSKKSGESDHGPLRMLACCQGLQSADFEVAKAKIAFSPLLVAICLFTVGQPFLADASKGRLLLAASVSATLKAVQMDTRR